MKNKIFKTICLTVAGFLCFGGLVGASLAKGSNRAEEALATDETVTISLHYTEYKKAWGGAVDSPKACSGTVKDITLTTDAGRWTNLNMVIKVNAYLQVSSVHYTFTRIDYTFYDSSLYRAENFVGGPDIDGYHYVNKSDVTAWWATTGNPKSSVKLTCCEWRPVAFTKLVITAIPNKYTVTYDANGGAGEIIDESSPYAYKSKVDILDNTFTAPEGKVFKCWNTKADGTGTSYPDKGAIASLGGNTTLYAIWEKPFSVTKTDYEGNYDGEAHLGSVTVADPETGYTLKYGTEEGTYNLSDCPTFTEVGEYTVYFKITASGYVDEVGSFSVKINENDKTLLASGIEKATELYNSLGDKTAEDVIALNTAIEAAQAVNDNVNVTEEEIAAALEALEEAVAKCGRSIIPDETRGTTIETKDGTLFPKTINLSVEVKADVKAEEGSAERETIEAKLAENEAIVKVFDVKLIKNEGGVETEVQPSDIKEGMILIISINVPEDVSTDDLRILHVHNASEMEFVEDFELADRVVKFEVSKLSELAFINKVSAPAPVDPSGSKNFPGWGIALIIIGAVILLACLCYLFLFYALNKWIREDDKALRAFVISKKDGRAKVMVMPFKFMYRDESEVYNSKEDALR